VLGTSASRAGALLTLMSIGWPLASSSTGYAWRWFGHRGTALLGTFCTVVSGLILSSAGAASPPWILGAGTFIMGMGLGFSQTTYIVTVQSRVTWNRRGVATGSNLFMRILGSTVWVALLGGVLNQQLHGYFTGSGSPTAALLAPEGGIAGLDVINLLLDPAGRAGLSAAVLAQLQEALARGMRSVFQLVLLTALAGFLLMWKLPRHPLGDGNGGH